MQNQAPTAYRCDLKDFLHDLLSFVEEQLKEAVAKPEDQLAAVDAASGVIPLMMDRLFEDQALLAQFMLALGDKIDERLWQEQWNKFAKMERGEFEVTAHKMLEAITALPP